MKMEQNNEKHMTKYDRKVLARQSAAKEEKKKDILRIISTVFIIVCIAALLIIAPIIKSRQAFKEYFKINDESVSELEFYFHRNTMINENSYILSYFGMSTVEDLETMIYDEEAGTTWAEFFAERTAQTILENKALIADAKAKNLSFDVDAEYDAYIEEATAAAEAEGLTLDSYFQTIFGASEKQLRPIIKDNLTALMYSEQLSETYGATDEEAQAEYDANKNTYDSVDYRVLPFMADVEDDAPEGDVVAAMDAAKGKAQEMIDKVNAGEDFETLCATYAIETKRTEYADETTDLSLVTGASYDYDYDPYLNWLFDEARKDGDTTIYTDENNNVHYALLFEKRYLGESVMDSIKQNLTYDAVMEYIGEISKDFTISDPDDNIPNL